MTGLVLHAPAKDIPAQLPKPDGKPGDATKPVKVYTLAGQSNMVGMGDIRGARPPQPNLFHSAGPAIIPGVVPIVPVSGGKAQASLPVARMAVGDPKQHPELVSTVASVDIRDFWRERPESPADQGYHYNRNPETYLLVGEAMGRAMVRMSGGESVAIPKSDREARTAARVAAEVVKPVAKAAQKVASLAAIKPMIVDGALAAYLSNTRYQPSLQAALKGGKPAKVSPLLGDALDEAGDYYRAAGFRDYGWKPFGGDINAATCESFSFDLPDPAAKAKGISDLKRIFPTGMENWFAPDNYGKLRRCTPEAIHDRYAKPGFAHRLGNDRIEPGFVEQAHDEE